MVVEPGRFTNPVPLKSWPSFRASNCVSCREIWDQKFSSKIKYPTRDELVKHRSIIFCPNSFSLFRSNVLDFSFFPNKKSVKIEYEKVINNGTCIINIVRSIRMERRCLDHDRRPYIMLGMRNEDNRN